MAEFCHECSIAMFGEDNGELAGIADEGRMVAVICEDCGIIYVDHDGLCMSSCSRGHYDKRIEEGYWATGGIVNPTSKNPREHTENPTS